MNKFRLALLLIPPALALSAYADRFSGGEGIEAGAQYQETQGTMKTVNDLKGVQDIVEPIKKYFDKCAIKGSRSNGADGLSEIRGTCKFKDMGISRDLHVGKPSCHHKGEAIDIGKINCGNYDIEPEKHTDSYMEIAKCLATDTDDTFKVIYRDNDKVENMMAGGEPGKHEDHMHIQLKTCHVTQSGPPVGKGQ